MTPFNEGSAYIALRAQKDLGTAVPVYAVPVALKYSYAEDVRQAVRSELDKWGKVIRAAGIKAQ